MLLGKVAQKAKCNPKTLDHYVRRGLIPFKTNPENEYREFDEEALHRIGLIRTLKKRPFRLDLDDIKGIFKKVPIPDLIAQKNASVQALHRFLSENNLL